MPETLWRASLVLALYRNRHVAHARFFQLATTRPDGRPANRTVVFRGFLGDSHSIMIVTDGRTAKIGEVDSNPWVEACWYFPMTREQFRISARARVFGAQTADASAALARRAAWHDLAEATRRSLTWPEPGSPRDSALPFVEGEVDPEVPPENFCLLVLDPAEVDHLELDGTPQNRWRYRLDPAGQWNGQEVHP